MNISENKGPHTISQLQRPSSSARPAKRQQHQTVGVVYLEITVDNGDR